MSSSPGANEAAPDSLALVPHTPNGETDLLSSENASHLVATPQSAVSQFAIDDSPPNSPNDGPEIYEGTDDDDDEENNTQDPSDSEIEEDDDVSGGVFGLAQRTNQIMSSYRDYISEIQNDPVEGGDAEAAKAELGLLDSNTSAGISSIPEDTPVVSPHRPFSYNHRDSHDRLNAQNLRDVTLPGEDGDNNGMGNTASFEDFYGELSFHPRRKYRFPWLRSKMFKQLVCSVLCMVVLLGVIGGVGSRSMGKNASTTVVEEGTTDVVGTTNNVVPTFDGNSGDVSRPFDSLDPNDAINVQSDQIGATYAAFYEKYEPEWFDRSEGWAGQTYVDALMFCAQNKEMIVCPYQAYCPLGPLTTPAGRTFDATVGEQYAPVVDKDNLWVRIDNVELCTKNMEPDWGKTGVGNEAITQHVMCCLPQEDEEDPAVPPPEAEQEAMMIAAKYDETFLKYLPETYDKQQGGWEGRTYMEAVQFCQDVKDNSGKPAGRRICPLDAICPLGRDTEPVGGYKPAGGDGAWVPILDRGNDFVQVGKSSQTDLSTCSSWTHMHKDKPEWGVSGKNSESLTSHVMCCIVPEDEIAQLELDEEEYENDKPDSAGFDYDPDYQEVGQKYKPMWFDRSDGWDGKTYLKALAFCASVEDMIICPYKALCPNGDGVLGARPYGGTKTASDGGLEVWAPVMDSLNEWTQIGPNDSCVKHSEMFSEPPAWGLTGASKRDITPYIMCCELNAENEMDEGVVVVQSSQEKDDQGSSASSFAGTNDAPPATTTTIATTQATTKATSNTAAVIDTNDSPPYAFAVERYKPIWYDRSNGWLGQTYDAALAFCASQKQDDGQEKLMLCPFEAFCPMGPQNKPLGGFTDEPTNWAPVSNDHNWWVSTSAENPCVFYNVLYGGHPDFGMSGKDDEGITRHVMCCNKHEVVSAIGQVMEPEETYDAEGDLVVTNPDENDLTVEQEMMAAINPQWFHRGEDWTGSTWHEAVDFCAYNGLVICDSGEVCPDGVGRPPFGGSFFEEPSGSWAPVMDDLNEWISISSDNVCISWANINQNPPEWGMTTGQEDLTRHILCCGYDTDGIVMTLPTETAAEIADEKKYMPQWFGRDDGWTGATYSEAIEFCATNEGLVICPHDAFCPDGDDTAPLDGSFDNDSWAPISDNFNDWVRVSSDNQCVVYSFMYGDVPDWGIGGNESVTRHIMCCAPVGGQALDATTMVPPGPNVEPTPTAQAVHSKESVENQAKPVAGEALPVAGETPDLPLEIQISEAYQPRWFGRPDGWKGSSYPEAIDWCANNQLTLCPYHAYCPYGANNPPLGTEPGMFANESPDGSWAPVSDNFNEWVRIDDAYECILWSNLNQNPPEWGVGSGEEEATNHIMCCEVFITDGEPLPVDTTTKATVATPDVGVHNEMGPPPKPATTTTTSTTTPATVQTQIDVSDDSVLISHALYEVGERFFAHWHDRSEGWLGQSYTEALMFCAEKGSYIPCPYEAYCPLGPGKHVMGGMKSTQTWAPMIDIPNGWVSVGPENTCMPYNAYNPYPPKWGLDGQGSEEITRLIMCCREPEDGIGVSLEDEVFTINSIDVETERTDEEMFIMDYHHPVWYDRRHGYQGTTHEESQKFCENIAGRRLCPMEAYCPNGIPKETAHDALFLDRKSFDGEQWAPFSTKRDGGGNAETDWVLIGTVGGYPTSTCSAYESTKSLAKWKASGNPSEHKQHVLCCADEERVDQVETLEEIMKDVVKPVWFDKLEGWNGGSYDDAESFCQSKDGREVCPYNAYCPYGSGKPVMGGHRHDFDRLGEQWAPVGGGLANNWVMIGQKYQNTASTCMTFDWLEGSSPGSWGGNGAMSALKQFIMCCSPEDQ